MAGVARRLANDLRGVAALAVDGVLGVTHVVERLHATITALPSPLGEAHAEATRGITGFAYRRVRDVTRGVGYGLDRVLAPFAGEFDIDSPGRDHVLAALNGVLGDRLHATANPLAIPMRLRAGDASAPTPVRPTRRPRNASASAPDRRPIAASFPAEPRLIALFLHGLCMHDGQWPRGEGTLDAAVRALGYAPHYLHYNTGRAIADNGRELSHLLDATLPRGAELAIIGHSMGGLVARSACDHARHEGAAWLATLRTLVFLGTPHRGAALERAGKRFDHLLAVSPYSAPFVALGGMRSAGIRDLGHGHLSVPGESTAPLPGVRTHALAGHLRFDSDGLVAVQSALGIPCTDARVIEGAGHLELMRHPETIAAVESWLSHPR